MVRDQLVEEGPPQPRLGRHLDDLELRVLELGQWPSERGPLLAILDRDLQHVFGGRHSADCADEPLLLEFHHQFQEARSLVAKAVCLRDSAVGEVELRRILAVPADLLDLFSFLESGSCRFDKVEIDRRVGVGFPGVAGSEDKQVAVDPVADEGLLAVDHDLVALFHGRRFHRGKVAPRVWFRHRDCGDDVAGDTAGEIFVLLLFRCEGEDVGDDDVGVERRREARRVRPGQLLRHDDGIEEVRPQAAVLLGDVHREKSLLAHPFPCPPGNDPRLLPLLDVGGDLLCEEPFQRIPKYPVLFRVLQNFHGHSPSPCLLPSRERDW